jgi:mannose-6-phosphate isomerase-like protein (cupin superfamily)
MSHTTVDYRETDAVGGGLHFLREELDCENLGFSVLEADPGWTGKPHDHAEDGQEEVYFLVEGAAEIEVDGETRSLAPGEAVRVAPEAERQLRNGDAESTVVIAGAP